MEERTVEFEIGRRHGVVCGEGHGGEEVSAKIAGIGVEDDEGDAPVENIIVDELEVC
jgi:hypothetical protein